MAVVVFIIIVVIIVVVIVVIVLSLRKQPIIQQSDRKVGVSERKVASVSERKVAVVSTRKVAADDGTIEFELRDSSGTRIDFPSSDRIDFPSPSDGAKAPRMQSFHYTAVIGSGEDKGSASAHQRDTIDFPSPSDRSVVIGVPEDVGTPSRYHQSTHVGPPGGRDHPVSGGRGHPQMDRRDHPVSGGRGHSQMDGRDQPQMDGKDYPGSGGRGHPQMDMKDYPGSGGRDHPQMDRKDHPESGGRGHPQMDRKDYPRSGGRGHPQMDEKGYLRTDGSTRTVGRSAILPSDKGPSHLLRSEHHQLQETGRFSLYPVREEIGRGRVATYLEGDLRSDRSSVSHSSLPGDSDRSSSHGSSVSHSSLPGSHSSLPGGSDRSSFSGSHSSLPGGSDRSSLPGGSDRSSLPGSHSSFSGSHSSLPGGLDRSSLPSLSGYPPLSGGNLISHGKLPRIPEEHNIVSRRDGVVLSYPPPIYDIDSQSASLPSDSSTERERVDDRRVSFKKADHPLPYQGDTLRSSYRDRTPHSSDGRIGSGSGISPHSVHEKHYSPHSIHGGVSHSSPHSIREKHYSVHERDEKHHSIRDSASHPYPHSVHGGASHPYPHSVHEKHPHSLHGDISHSSDPSRTGISSHSVRTSISPYSSYPSRYLSDRDHDSSSSLLKDETSEAVILPGRPRDLRVRDSPSRVGRYRTGSDLSSVEEDSEHSGPITAASASSDKSSSSTPFTKAPCGSKVSTKIGKVIDVCSFTTDTLIAMRNGSIMKHNDRKGFVTIHSQPEIERFAIFGEKLYALSKNMLYSLPSESYATDRWIWKHCEWAPVGIKHVSCTLSGAHIWIQTSTQAYLIDITLRQEAKVDHDPHVIRSYGYDIYNYIDIDTRTHVGIQYPKKQVHKNVHKAIIDSHGTVTSIDINQYDRVRDIRLVGHVPWYII